MAEARRSTDGEEEDYRALRHADRHVLQIGGAVLTLLLGVTGWLIAQDRNRLETRLDRVETVSITLTRVQAEQSRESQVRWEEIKGALLEIKGDVKELRRRR